MLSIHLPPTDEQILNVFIEMGSLLSVRGKDRPSVGRLALTPNALKLQRRIAKNANYLSPTVGNVEKARIDVAPCLPFLRVMPNWQRAESLLGETVREMGVLVAVFAPLEAIFTDASVSRTVVAALFLVGLLLVAGGIILEARK